MNNNQRTYQCIDLIFKHHSSDESAQRAYQFMSDCFHKFDNKLMPKPLKDFLVKEYEDAADEHNTVHQRILHLLSLGMYDEEQGLSLPVEEDVEDW